MADNKTQLDSFHDNDHDKLLQGQEEVYKHLFSYANSLVLRAAIELGIPDIIHSHNQPMTLSEIASKIESPHIDMASLARVMRMLVRNKIFTINHNNNNSNNQSLLGEPTYGLTTTSNYLRQNYEFTLAPLFLRLTHSIMVKPWFAISRSIKEGGNPFVLAHGQTIWEMMANNKEFNNVFNLGMASATKIKIDDTIKGYKEGFSKLQGTLVDVGGGMGSLVAKIVENYPHIKGINFDLHHVIENAPQYHGVTHVGGDMLKEIPCADNVIIKSVLLDWNDEDCVKILKNCLKAVSQKKGKVIIVDIILHPYRYEMFDDATMALDMVMLTNSINGKNRTMDEWNLLLKQVGVNRVNFIPLKTSMSLSIIEAFHP